MPRTFSTKSRRRGTAWQATTVGTIPTSPSPGKGRSSVSSDPAFDYEEGESQKLVSNIKVRKVFSMKSGKECLDTEANPATMDEAPTKPSKATTTSEKDQTIQEETRGKMKALEIRVGELENELKIRQLAIGEKDGQIKIMARDLDEMKQERVSLDKRLVEAESSSSFVIKENEQFKKEFTEQKTSLGDLAQATECRFVSLEKQILEGKEALKQLENDQKWLANRSGDHQKAFGTLTGRLAASETLVAQLQVDIERQNKQAADEREAFQMKLESIEKVMNNKNNRIHNLEGCLQDSAKEARQLKALLTQLNEKFASKEVSKKRMLEAKTHNTKSEHAPRRKTHKRSDHSATDWLSKYES
uniref:Uncharacterized protein n=1 Tax=Amphora coffeiformis TaxID=265554 RepID=A0A7S3PAL9_9STRA